MKNENISSDIKAEHGCACMRKINEVLLINPVLVENLPPRNISFGIAYIAQQLMSYGYGVEILDVDTHRYDKKEVLERIEKSSCDIIGIGSLVTAYSYLSWLIPAIKDLKPDIKIVLGGGIATAIPERCLVRFDIDYAVIGEGEVTIIELLKTLNENRSVKDVAGIAFRDNDEVIFTVPRPHMPSLDDVPALNTALFPVEKILNNSKGVFAIHAQRGCPWRCTFCFNCFRTSETSRVRYRPVKNVVDEIESLHKRLPIKYFYLSGECVVVNKRWILAFCKELIERKLKIKYRVTSRLDTLDEERLKWLSQSGCEILSFGLESGSPKILKIMKKNINLEKAKQILKLAQKYIPTIEVSIMYGYIGETEETIKETTTYCKELNILPAYFFATAYPGTELWDMAIEQGHIKDEEEAMMNLSSITDFNINLTKMTDEEILRLQKESKREMQMHYFLRNPFVLPEKFFGLLKNKRLKTRYAKNQNLFSSKS
ncbi:MAG: B12-binding domain-containing radical SAM protein [Planctomycetes bacterium]|nr:B12-binding domain-containing radical SAM protein [Planctomycetota bacterium]